MTIRHPTQKPKNVAEYISWQISLSEKTQAQIAEECGFEKPNVITMIKQNKTKVPVSKIGRMAKALNVDPVYFMRLCLAEYWPDAVDMIETVTKNPIVTANEMEFIELIRSSKVSNPKIANQAQRKALLDVINGMKTDNEFQPEK